MYENLLVGVDWLAAHLDEVRVVDVRDAWEYDGIGHVPGAVGIPFDEFRSEKGDGAEPRSAESSSGSRPRDEGMLPGAETWADLLGNAGISADDTIVAYDDTHGVFAARFLVTAELYGHTDFHLLNGDYSAWNREQPTTTDAPDVETIEYEVREPTNSPLVGREVVEDVAGPRPAGTSDAEASEDAIGSDAVLVDTRSPDEFAEGHIPGAVNLDWIDLVDDETRGIKPAAELESLLAEKGITPEKQVILYCNTARRISHTYVVLRSLGYEELGFYEESLTEWIEVGGEMEKGER